jgi:hypothetical protein
MSLPLTSQAEKAYLIWSHYQSEMVSDKYRTSTHKKIIKEQEEIWREEYLNLTEYMIPSIMEAAGATLIDGDIKF